MATWIAHLRIAENLINRIGQLDPENFVIGSIAPDYGIPKELRENGQGIPRDTHFRQPDDSHIRMGDLEFYRRDIGSLSQLANSPERLSFLLGYYLHLVADNLWSLEIFRPTRNRFTEEFDKNPDFVWEVKRDWYGIDFAYIRKETDSIYWRVFTDCQYKNDYLDFMPQKSVNKNIERIKDFYQNKTNVLENWIRKRPEIYLSELEMDRFIEDASIKLHSIYEYLLTNDLRETEYSSILEIQPTDNVSN